MFRLTRADPATGVDEDLGTRTSEELQHGIDVPIAHEYGYAIISVARASRAAGPPHAHVATRDPFWCRFGDTSGA